MSIFTNSLIGVKPPRMKTKAEMLAEQMQNIQNDPAETTNSDDEMFAQASYNTPRPISKPIFTGDPRLVERAKAGQFIRNNPFTVDAKIDDMDKGIDSKMPGVEGTGLSTIGMANWGTAAITAANVGTSLYGAYQASKMKAPPLMHSTPLSPVLMQDTTAAQQVSGEQDINRTIGTAAAAYQRNGLIGMNGVLMSSQNKGLNDLSAELEKYKTSVSNQNAQIQNQTAQFNSATEQRNNEVNLNAQTNFQKFQSDLISTGTKNATDALSSGVGSIIGNTYSAQTNQLASINSEIGQLQEYFKTATPNFGSVNQEVYKANEKRLKELQMQASQTKNSLYGQPLPQNR